MAKYKAYPEYKDSGVEWLGEIPTYWQTLRGKYVFKEVRELSTTGDEILLSVSEYYGVKPRQDTIEDGDFISRADSLVGYKKCQVNDLAMNIMLAWKTGLGVSNYDGIISPAYSVFRFDTAKAQPEYMHYLLRTKIYTTQFKSLSTGVIDSRLRLYPETFGIVEILLPSLGEQKKICAFLSHETAKIDNLIEKQQQLIELLKEKCQAVISHAVTKGLNSDVPMKDSGVEWLGEIPQHWGVTRLKYECRNIVDCPHSTPNYTDEGEYPAIRTADILAGYLDLENCRRVTEPVYDERNFRLIPKAGDIIYSREGERFGIGAPIPEGAKVCLAQRVMLFRAKSTPGYLMWALNSSSTYTQAQQDCIGSTSPHVNVDTIKNFILAWPPENEREEISNFIHQTLDSVESLTAHLNEKLTLLQERRTALISAAVTGKIDVRDWVAPETQDVEEPQEATA